jgi:hypothetical protein
MRIKESTDGVITGVYAWSDIRISVQGGETRQEHVCSPGRFVLRVECARKVKGGPFPGIARPVAAIR